MDQDRLSPTQVKYAGFWLRCIASLIDTVFMLLLLAPLIYVFMGGESLHNMLAQIKLMLDLISGQETATGFLARAQPLMEHKEESGLISALINYVVPFVCIVVFWKYRAATPGKIMLGMNIVDATTLEPPGMGQLILRYAGYFVSLLAMGTGFLWIGVDKRKQGFHDKMANTVVIMVPKHTG